jgi:transcription elongation factor Elf1
MAGLLNAKVIMARCSKNQKCFGIRIEQRENDWVRTWAFPIDEQKAKHEGYDANKVTGSMNAVDNYPGCPHCGSSGFVQCSCGKIGCWIGAEGTTKYTCPWCKKESEVQIADRFDVSGGGY